nr:uncharacterized protein LOC129259268 [Lytechinus pictus]
MHDLFYSLTFKTCTESTDKERHNVAISDGFTTLKEAQRPRDEKEQSIMQIETQTQTAEGEEDHTDDEEYDLIILKKHSITVRISKYETYSAKDIIPEVIEDVPTELGLKETGVIISVGLKMSPSDAMFDSPVRVTMPHCGAFTEPQDAEVYICYRKNDATKFTAIRSTSLSSPRCVMRHRDLDIYLNHFSEFRIVAILTEMFIGKRVICTPIIPLSAPINCMPVLYVNVRDHNVVEQIPEGHKAPIPGEQFLVRWKSGGLKISCKESTLKDEAEIIQESEFHHLTVHKVMFEVDKQNITQNEVNLHITLEQSTTKKLIIPMSLNAMVISEGGAILPSTIPLSPLSEGIHLEETIGSGSSETKSLTDKGVNDFDDILKTIAREIFRDSDIHDLGGKLGFIPADIQRYTQANKDGDYMGTWNMLRRWREGTTESEERQQLRRALIDIKYNRLADTLFTNLAK